MGHTKHTHNTYIDGHRIMVNKPERAHLGEGAPETVCEMNSSLCPEVTTANQRLFVAAPGLLAALEALYTETVSYIEVNNLGDPHHNQSMQDARAAIAKAKGGQ